MCIFIREVLLQPLWAGGTELPTRGLSSPAMHLMHRLQQEPCSQLNQVSEDVRIIAVDFLVVEIWRAKAALFLCGKTGPPPPPKPCTPDSISPRSFRTTRASGAS